MKQLGITKAGVGNVIKLLILIASATCIIFLIAVVRVQNERNERAKQSKVRHLALKMLFIFEGSDMKAKNLNDIAEYARSHPQYLKNEDRDTFERILGEIERSGMSFKVPEGCSGFYQEDRCTSDIIVMGK